MPGPAFYFSSLVLSSYEIKSGQTVSGTITFESAATDDGTILLTTNTVGADVDASVAVTATDTSASFSLATSGLNPNTYVTVSAHYYGQTYSVKLRILPANIGSMFFSSASVSGGDTVDLTIELDSSDNVGGITVYLTQSMPSGNYAPMFIDLPFTVDITAGNTSETVTLTTREVSRQLYSKITATYLDQEANASLLVVP